MPVLQWISQHHLACGDLLFPLEMKACCLLLRSCWFFVSLNALLNSALSECRFSREWWLSSNALRSCDDGGHLTGRMSGLDFLRTSSSATEEGQKAAARIGIEQTQGSPLQQRTACYLPLRTDIFTLLSCTYRIRGKRYFLVSYWKWSLWSCLCCSAVGSAESHFGEANTAPARHSGHYVRACRPDFKISFRMWDESLVFSQPWPSKRAKVRGHLPGWITTVDSFRVGRRRWSETEPSSPFGRSRGFGTHDCSWLLLPGC